MLFAIMCTTNIPDNKFGISRYGWLGSSSLPCLSQQCVGQVCSLLLDYLQAGKVTVDPATVDTMSNNVQQALKLINRAKRRWRGSFRTWRRPSSTGGRSGRSSRRPSRPSRGWRTRRSERGSDKQRKEKQKQVSSFGATTFCQWQILPMRQFAKATIF